MIADINIHAPDRKGDQRNHHAHVMLTMRTLTGDGFGKKVREWNGTEQLKEWRKQWAKTSQSPPRACRPRGAGRSPQQ